MLYLGEVLSLGAALVWAFAVLFLRKSGETAGPFALNLFRVGISSILFIITLLVLGENLFPSRPIEDYVWLTLSGIVGIALSDTLFHKSLNLLGAGLNSIVDCLYAPMVMMVAFFFIGERVGGWQFAGMALVIGGVVVTTKAVPPEGATRKDLLMGIIWGAAAMLTLALGVVWAKPVLKEGSLLWATACRQVVSFLAMAPIALASPKRREIWSVFKPTREWRFTLPGTILGSYLALQLWLGGMKHTAASTAAILNQTNTIFVLILAAVFLHEPFTARRWFAAALALGGILMVTFG